MTQHTADDLWRDFPKTAPQFEARFATEEPLRAYWIEGQIVPDARVVTDRLAGYDSDSLGERPC